MTHRAASHVVLLPNDMPASVDHRCRDKLRADAGNDHSSCAAWCAALMGPATGPHGDDLRLARHRGGDYGSGTPAVVLLNDQSSQDAWDWHVLGDGRRAADSDYRPQGFAELNAWEYSATLRDHGRAATPSSRITMLHRPNVLVVRLSVHA